MAGHKPDDVGAGRKAPAERARTDVRQDLAAFHAFVEAHGSFADMVREHYAVVDGDAPVLSAAQSIPVRDRRGDRETVRFSRGAR